MPQVIFKQQPEGFKPQFEVVSCLALWDGRILLLHRLETKPQGDSWGVPAGKKAEGETTRQAMVRELFEETGIIVDESSLDHAGTVFVRYPDYDFIYHTFKLNLVEEPIVEINDTEHKAFKFLTPRDAIDMPGLMLGERECIQMYLMDIG